MPRIDLERYLKSMILSELEDIVGKGNVSDKEVDRTVYGMDSYWISQMWLDRGQRIPIPDFVIFPETVEQISRIVRLANKYRIPVIPYGAGSGSQGGITPIYGGITIDMKKLSKIIEINSTALTVTVQTGVIAYDLECALNKEGFTLNHYPASIYCSTIGGFLAHRGSGVFSTKYGKMDDMVLGMEVVLPNGEIIRIKPIPAHSAGPDLNKFFVGTEGTFGIITEATFKIHYLPEERRFRAYMFKDLHGGFEAGRKIMIQRIRPLILRLYDEPSTEKFVKKLLGVKGEGAYLVVGFDGFKKIVDVEEELAHSICRAEGGEDMGREIGDLWWENRYKFYYPPFKPALPTAYGTMDTVSSFDNVERIYWAMKKAIEGNYPGATFTSHMSHWYEWGCMQYNRFFLDDPPQDPGEALRLYNEIWNTGIRAALANGGVINEHHGVGIKLARFMEENYGSAFQVLDKIKRALDPSNIMNPGKLGFGGY